MHAANEPITPDPRRSPKPAQRHGIGCARQEGRKQARSTIGFRGGAGQVASENPPWTRLRRPKQHVADARRVQSKAGVTAITRCRPRRAA
jgi:hypothetical protein